MLISHKQHLNLMLMNTHKSLNNILFISNTSKTTHKTHPLTEDSQTSKIARISISLTLLKISMFFIEVKSPLVKFAELILQHYSISQIVIHPLAHSNKNNLPL